jgi:16S rRNA (guanine527-N7)-methyltransferase
MSSRSDDVDVGPELVAVLEESRRRGFLGPGPVLSHVEHALALGEAAQMWSPPAASAEPPAASGRVGSADLAPRSNPALDLGAGGGVPGLVLALTVPASRWVLLDANDRRTVFLREVVEQLRIDDRVEVVRARAEEFAHDERQRERYDVVTARAFAAPAVTAECGGALLRLGGVLVVSDPPEPERDRWPKAPLAALGLAATSAQVRGFRFTRLQKVDATPPDRPRRRGLPAKRPLF